MMTSFWYYCCCPNNFYLGARHILGVVVVVNSKSFMSDGLWSPFSTHLFMYAKSIEITPKIWDKMIFLYVLNPKKHNEWFQRKVCFTNVRHFYFFFVLYRHVDEINICDIYMNLTVSSLLFRCTWSVRARQIIYV